MTGKKKLIVAFTWLLLSTGGVLLAILAGTHLYLSPSLPSVETLRDIRLQTPLRIYSNDGKLIGEIGEMRRTPVKYQDIPQGYIDALLSAEDAQFYSHKGVSIRGLMRASSQLLASGDIQGGGSTITMQVARNYFLSARREFKRKFNEILLALRIERELSKEQILELYVNIIFMGNRAYGIQAASQVYYGKQLHELDLAQLAMLAGLPKAPSTMNPLANPTRALQRRDWILGRMLELGKIDEPTYHQAKAEPVAARYHGSNIELNAAYVAEMARQQAVELFGTRAYTDGYRIYTTVDSQLQAHAQKAVIDGLLEYDVRHGYRGPEAQLPVPDVIAELLQPTEDAEESPELNRLASQRPEFSEWFATLQSALAELPVYAHLQPAAVVAVGNQSFKAIMADGELVDIGWELGLSDARKYLSVNSLGPRPKQADDVVALGDVIRLRRQDDKQWRLVQLPDVQGSLVSLNPVNGAIVALVGGMDFRQSNFNRVIQARRQPGSSFKPFIYTAALEHGHTAASVINDAPIVFDTDQLPSAWRPENESRQFYGPTRLRKAMYLSRNLVSIRLLQAIGIDTALASLDRFGFDASKMPRDLSLVLGSHALTPLEMAGGYAVFANGGFRVEPYFIDRILDFDGKPVYETLPPTACHRCGDEGRNLDPVGGDNSPFRFRGDPFELSRAIKAKTGTLEPEDFPRARQVVSDQVAYLMDSMLKDVVTRGTATRAKVLERGDLAGKTGTTNNATDAWFAGYGGGLVTTTWLGFDQVATLGRREFGGTAALPIWISFMGKALEGRPESHLPRPPGLVTVRINPDTGARAQVGEPNAIFEIFQENNVPQLDGNGQQEPNGWDADSGPIGTDDIF